MQSNECEAMINPKVGDTYRNIEDGLDYRIVCIAEHVSSVGRTLWNTVACFTRSDDGHQKVWHDRLDRFTQTDVRCIDGKPAIVDVYTVVTP